MRTPYTAQQSLAWRGLVMIGLLVAIAVLAWSGCAKKQVRLDLGPAVSAVSLQNAVGGYTITGDSSYAVVSSSALRAFYDDFRSEIFRNGVTKWEPRFDCNHFAAYYVALAQTRYYLANFHSGTAPQSLAVGVFWYRPNVGPNGHAIVMALTERGVIYLEPQDGRELQLTAAEKQTAYLRLF